MAARAKQHSEKPFLVVAIDFGTTYSGYAFSFLSDYEKDPTKISCNQWPAGSNQLISMKTPTTLLLRWREAEKEFSFEGFGYEAEDKYTSLVEDDDHSDYYLARRFKMDLYKQTTATGLSRDLKIQLGRNKSINAMKAFSMCIEYLKKHFLESVAKRGAKVTDDDIKWVLTVPAIWTDGAKQFMREAAVMAGITTDKLIIALEPEAASLYCLHLPSLDSETDDQDRFPKGTQYMVVDCGGGTIDICVHEVVGKHTVVEKHVASGGNWGGTQVDENFLKIWMDIVGRDIFRRFEEKHREDLTEMYREFEFKKRCLRPEQQKLTIRLPVALVDLLKQSKKSTTFESAVSESKHAGKITCHKDKLKLDMTLIQNSFDEPVRNTVNHVKNVLKDKSCKGVDTIVLVGGFAESIFLQDAMRDNLHNMRIIVPEDPGLAVVKGAVVFGHNPLTIQARFAKYTYGMCAVAESHIVITPREQLSRGTTSTRKAGRHQPRPGAKVLSFIEPNSFDIHVKKGERLKVGQPQEPRRYHPINPNQMVVLLPFFTSTETDPELVTDKGCSHIGSVMLELTETGYGRNRPIIVTLTFGGTEIEVSAVEESTHRETKAKLECLV